MERNYKIYRKLFWSLLVLNVVSIISVVVYNNSKQQQLQNQTQIVSNDSARNEIQKQFNNQFERLDSLKTANKKLMQELGRKSFDTSNMTMEEKRIVRLIDSTYMVKDSINEIINYMNDSIDLSILSKEQINNYSSTIGLLGQVKIRMDLNLDKYRIKFLQQDGIALSAIISKFDNNVKALSNLTNRLTKVSKFIKITIDVLSNAIFQNIVIAPPKT
jgi:uncharacterized membrane-anchored protein YhcB (DUF1043 family)